VCLLGIDLGAAEVKIALCAGSGAPLHTARAPSRGHPLAALMRMLSNLPAQWRQGGAVRVGVTGGGRPLLEGVGECFRVNEVVATALAVRRSFPQARTAMDLGGQSSKWIVLGRDDREGLVLDFAGNGLCAAGAGAFLEQQACRLGLTLERLGEIAAGAPRGATIAGRCSVFAKSDMIHLQQKGTPLEEIAYGLCQALARTFLATVVQGRAVEPPVMLLGGGAANPGLVRAFREQLGLSDEQVLAPENAPYFGALGAAQIAVDTPATEWERLLRVVQERAEAAPRVVDTGDPMLAPLVDFADENGPQPDEDPPAIEGEVEAYLGVDVGSVSTNLVLLSPQFKVLQGIYLPTAGRPVDVLHQGLMRIRERYGQRLRVLGVGATGSGRHLAARVLGADVTYNEITAQTVSSLFYAPQVDTIFEIGGQDSKYISVREGTLADFEMNKICAGGTGSFLEEQAERLGIRIVGEFAEHALRGKNPCDLGTRCTVFMDTELVRAQERGAPLEDICAGLAYAVARNYLEKVVAGRPIGRAIMFQGGTASNRAVVAAFRQLLGRPVHVHPYNRISGAIGAGLLAARATRQRSSFLGLDSCAGARLKSFECQKCENRCQVNRVQIGARAVHFGDVCERYSQRDRERREIRRPFPELFAERERLLESYLATNDETNGRPRVGLLRATLNLEYLPFWATFLRELGYAPVISGHTTSAQIQEFAGGLPAEVCLPIKAAAAHARALLGSGSVERIFLPALLECPPRTKGEPSHTCFYVQELPDMLRSELQERVITAQFAIGEGILGLVGPIFALAEALDRPLDDVLLAMNRAREVQAQFGAARKRLGREALNSAFDRAVVVFGRPYNTHDPFLNLWLARHLEQIGLPAIPWDLLPLDEVRLDERWQTVPWHYNRDQLRALELIRRDKRLYALLVSSYGCGPDAFTVKHLEELLAGRPRLLLEFDEHRGEAGLVTRLEAFAEEIEEHQKTQKHEVAPQAMTPGPRALPAGKRFFLPNFSEHARIYAAALRAAGFAAEVLPPPDEQTVRLGEKYASGRECHPFTILAGELMRFLQTQSPAEEDVFFLPSTKAPCLLRQYGDAFRILVEQQGLPRVEVWDANSEQIGKLIGMPGLLRLYEGLLATDILIVLSTRLRPYAELEHSIERVQAKGLEEIARAVAERSRLDNVLAHAASGLWSVPRIGEPGTRPVVGVTGDLYTRMNPAGNAGLFRRLEQMGCEVWPSPFFATIIDLAAEVNFPKLAEHWRLKEAALEGLTRFLTAEVRRRLTSGLAPEVTALAVEPPAEELLRLAQRYVGPRTNYLILLGAAKIADFLRRGASGAINAAGINCVVGTATASVIPAIRADFGGAPVITLIYGSTEGPTQRIRLETFVHQVHKRWWMGAGASECKFPVDQVLTAGV